MAAPKRSGAGALNHKVRFERREVTEPDELGNAELDWVPQFDEPCRLVPRLGSEPVIAGRLAGVQPYTLVVRAHTRTLGVMPAWRAVNARTGDVYNVKAVANVDERGAWLEMLVVAGEGT